MHDLGEYRDELQKRLNPARSVLNTVYARARASMMRIVFPEGDAPRVLLAVRTILEERIAQPILLGHPGTIREVLKSMKIDLPHVTIIDPLTADDAAEMAEQYFSQRARKGITLAEAKHLFRSRAYYAAMMVAQGKADGVVSGVTRAYPNAVRPLLEVVGTPPNVKALAMYMMVFKEGIQFLSDTALNLDPSAEELAPIAIQTADRVQYDFGITPRIAVLSFSNFGSVRASSSKKAADAVRLVKDRRPDLEIDGEMQADIALDADKRSEQFPFTTLQHNANVLIFSNVESANIAYKLLQNLASCDAVGPILVGMKHAVNVCQLHCSVKEIVQMCAITAAHAQDLQHPAQAYAMRDEA